MKKNKRWVIAGIGIGVMSIVSISSASALEIPNPLAKVFDQWQEQINSINKYVSSTISQKIEDLSESLQGDLSAAVNESVGSLGLPDATETREKIEEIVASANTAVNPVDRTTNEIDRQITRADSDSTLSKEGQQITKGQPLALATQSLRGIINQTNQTLLASTSASIQLQEAYQQVMLKTGKGDAIQSLVNQCNAIADPTQQTQCLENAAAQAQEIEANLNQDNRPEWLKSISDFFNTNVFQLAVRGWLFGFAIAFQWVIEVCMLLTALLGPLAVGGSLLPVGSKAIFAWLTGFFSVGMIKLCFNIISGLVATMVLNADNNDPMIFAFAIGILAPILSVVLAAGGGMAVFNSFSSIATFGVSTFVQRMVNRRSY